MKKKSVLILVVLCLVVSMFALVACNDDKAPEKKEGVLYQSDVESFWVGIGKAYMTLEHSTEPETPEEGKLYGNVFNVIVSADSGKTYTPWLSGTWSIENGVLTLNATWQDGDKSTMLADATSGQDKTYLRKDGKFTIGVKLPSAGTVNFVIAVEGEDGKETSQACTDHVDENNDGKCDKCGATVEVPAQVQLTMLSEANAYGQTAKIEMMTDGTWKLGISYYTGGDFTETASGTWVANGYESMTLTVTKDEASVLDATAYTVPFDFATNPGNITYALIIKCNVPQVGELTFALSAKVAMPQQ